MNRINIPILTAVVGVIFGILLYSIWKPSWPVLGLGIFAFFSLGILLHKRAQKELPIPWLFQVNISSLWVFIGVMCACINNPKSAQDHYIHSENSNPQLLSLVVDKILKPTAFQRKYIVKIIARDSVRTTGNLLLNIYIDSTVTSLKIGQHLKAYGSIQKLPSPSYPYQFDYGAYLEKQHVYGQLNLQPAQVLGLSKKSSSILSIIGRFRESALENINQYPFTTSQKGIIKAIILGHRHDIDKELNEQYADAGMIHILAVSGLHIGIVMLLLRRITFMLGSHKLRTVRFVLIVIGIWGFAFLSGASPSVLRAATMFSFLQLGNSLGKKNQSATAVLFSALLLLLIDPMMLYQIGFQMSYLAVIAILWIQPWLSQIVYPKYYFTRLIWGILTVSISAQLGVLPLSLYYFHQFPGLFLFSNILVLPFLGLLLVCGIIVVGLAMANLLPAWLVKVYGSVIDILNSYIGWIAEKEAFIIEYITFSVETLVTSYILIIFGILVLKRANFKRLATLLIAVLLFLGAFQYNYHHDKPSHFIIFQQSRKSLIGIIHNRQLELYARDTLALKNGTKARDYKNALFIESVASQYLPNVFRFKRKNILLVDSLGIYEVRALEPDYLVLSQSPNINLDRVIKRYPKVHIIADGTNYRIDIERWKATCEQQKIPFHSTYEKGAFVIE